MTTARVIPLAAFLSLSIALHVQAADLAIVNLSCELQTEQVVIDVPQPRLGWQLQSSARGVRQTAYRVRVSSAPDRVGDVWDSGKVASDQSQHVRYDGPPLRPLRKYYWTVQVWTDDSEAVSDVATWSTAFFAPEDWQADWIAAPGPESMSLKDAHWIWTAEQPDGLMHPPGRRYFRWKMQLPPNSKVEQGHVAMAADNSFTLYVNSDEVGSGTAWESLEQFDISGLLRAGENVLAIVADNGGTAPNEVGVIGKLMVTLEGGQELSLILDAAALTADTEYPGWKSPEFDDSAWQPARVLGPYGMAPWGSPVVRSKALPLLRRDFVVQRPVRRAMAYVCGLGFHELRLNGEKVGDDQLEPGWTNYRKTCLYSSYDVTKLIRQGNNTIGAMLGNGMYNVTGGRYIKFLGSFGEPKLILELHVEYVDGTVQRVLSDASWRCTAGPIRFSCIYGGEDYDARKEVPQWDRPGFDDAGWSAATQVQGPGGRLQARSMPPIRVREEFTPITITQPRPGVYVYDLGQNFSGWPQLSVSGPAGASVKLIPGELLDDQGTVSQRSSGGPVWFAYTLKGEGKELWRPRFSFTGFRYVQLEGGVPAAESSAPAEIPRVPELKGQFLYPAADTTGEFACSNNDVNRVHALILAAIKSNFKSVLTDCPHREKLGWLECSHLLAGCFMYNFDCAQFYEKIADDMREAQLENGLVPDIAPEYTVFSGGFRDSPEWGSAIAISPWRAYRMYGDIEILRQNYEAMKRYVAYLGSTATDHIVAHGLGDWCDIGPAGPGPSQLTSLSLTATGVYYQDIEILSRVAALLGREDDENTYTQLADQVRAAFLDKLFHADKNSFDRNSQTANAMPLFLDLVPPDRRSAVLGNLVENIRGNGNRVTAGDVGFYYVVQALLDGRRSDVLYDMLCQTSGPGYMYQLEHGATSLVETWDMNPATSQNHCMLGHIEEWFYSGLLGIRPESPGFRQIIIRPAMPAGLASAAGHYDTLYGRIASRWERSDDDAGQSAAGRVSLQITVPPNTTATVYIPATDVAAITESGRPATDAPGVTFLRLEEDAAVFSVGSGDYHFEKAAELAR